MSSLHKHYTGFTLTEQKLILEKLNEFIISCYLEQKDFDYPNYGGIPDRLNKLKLIFGIGQSKGCCATVPHCKHYSKSHSAMVYEKSKNVRG